MPLPNDARSDRATLIYRHYERLYRLALLVAGNAATATTLVQSAYQQLPAEIDDPTATETLLIRALLDSRILRRNRWRLTPPDLTRTTLDHQQATALFRLLARLTPAARLVIGLAYINGSAPAELAALLPPPASETTPADVLAHFRTAATRALGLAPADADSQALARLDRLAAGQLDEQEAIEVRRELIAQPRMRELRDGMLATHDLLPQAIPALFAAAPPPALVDQLLALAQGPRAPRLPAMPARRAQALLAVGVLALAAAIILGPSLAARMSATTARRAPTVAELIESAIHRFDRAPLQRGVLHEQYRVERDGRGAYLIERWYDYASPNRLAISVSQEGRGGPPLLQVGSDGRSLVQLRYSRARSFGQQPVDVHVAPAEAQRLMPLLRGMPRPAGFGRAGDGPGDPGAQYLAQARAAGASYLGQTTIFGRPAYLLTYQTSRPPELAPQPSAGQPARVLLTIDAQTSALLDVAVVPAGEGESTARHPLQAQQFELLDDAPAERFALPSSPEVSQRTELASVQFPFIDNGLLLSIDDAAQQMPDQLLAPLRLPDTNMRGLAVRNNGPASPADVILLYEGEFQNIIVLPSFRPGSGENVGEEQAAGAFRYRLIGDAGRGGGLAAVVYRPEAPTEPLGLILNDDFATPEEREATLRDMIESLTPINDQSLPVLRRTFQPASAAGGT